MSADRGGRLAPDASGSAASGRSNARHHAAAAGGSSARRFLLDLVAYARWRAALAFVLSLAAGVSEGVGLLTLGPLLHALQAAPEDSPIADAMAGAFRAIGVPLTLPAVVSVFIALIALRTLLLRASEIVLVEIELGYVDHLRSRLFAALSRAEWVFLNGIRTSDFAHVLTNEVDRVALCTRTTFQLATGALIALVQVSLALTISATSTLVALGAGALLVIALRAELRRGERLGRELTAHSARLFDNVTEFLAGLKLAKSYVAEEFHRALFDRSTASARASYLAFIRANVRVQTIYQIGGAVGLGVFLFLASEVLHLPAPELLILVAIFARFLPTALNILQRLHHTLHSLPAFDVAMALCAEADAAREPEAGAADRVPPLEHEVRLHDVHYGYGRGGFPQAGLAGIDLVVPARQITALVGPSGAGKTTLADLLMGLFLPDAGRVEVDGRPLTREALRGWRANVAYVPQEPFLFHETVRFNLLWGRPDASEADLWRALGAAAAADLVETLPDGLDTMVGDRGTRLSGGERQRVALARALLRNPSLLILDEATSALDPVSERRVHAAITALRSRLTVVLIAHRLSTVRSANRIVVMDAGRIVETGTWDELTARPQGLFAALRRAADHEVMLDPDPAEGAVHPVRATQEGAP